jgi:hypothetical protein
MGRTTMNRWALHRYTMAGLWFRDRVDRMADRTRRADRGQTSFEYLGIVIVIVVIIGVLAGTTDIGTKIKNAINSAIDNITSHG